MNKIKCTKQKMNSILKKAVNDLYAGKISKVEYDKLEFDIVPLDLSRFKKLKPHTADYISNNFDEETTDRNGNYMLRGFIGDSLDLWYRDKENLGCNYAPYGFYYSGFGFNDTEMLIYTWCEGDTTVTLFADYDVYIKERKNTEKWFDENT